MHILILGGSGRTGQLVVADALERGHQVTVLVRKGDSFKPTANLTIVVGTPENKENILSAFQAKFGTPSAVITTLAAPRASDSPFAKPLVPRFFMRDCIANLTAVMKEKEVARIVILSSFGVGTSRSQTPWILNMLFRHTNMEPQFEDHDAVETHIRATGLCWTLVRPGMLKDKPATQLRILADNTKEVSMFASIARSNVAEFLVNTAEGSDLERSAVAIIN